MIVPIERCQRQRDRLVTLALVGIVIHHGRPLLDHPRSGDHPSSKEQGLCQARLAAALVPHEHHVPDLFGRPHRDPFRARPVSTSDILCGNRPRARTLESDVGRLRCGGDVSRCGRDQSGDVDVERGQPAGGVGGERDVDGSGVPDLHVGVMLVVLSDHRNRSHQVGAGEVGRRTEHRSDCWTVDDRPIADPLQCGELSGLNLGVLHRQSLPPATLCFGPDPERQGATPAL